MTRILTPPPDGDSPDETRLASSATGDRPGSFAPDGWLSTSGGIGHGHFPPGAIPGGHYWMVAILVLLALAGSAFHASRAGHGLLRRLLPVA